jgi:di/tripeptidase
LICSTRIERKIPNIFAGGRAFHSRLVTVSVRDMKKAARTIVNLAMIGE